MEKTKIICLTPIKNEAWILREFLESASIWADHIIIADQNSTDSSLEIIKMFPKVILIKNDCEVFNEPERQKMLINEARKIDGKKILIALDADESLTANIIKSSEWEYIKNLENGTVIRFDLVNLLPKKNLYWLAPLKKPFGFVDDGSPHIGSVIHSTRIPLSEKKLEYFPNDIKVMHFQFADWERMESKHRWYQCWEHINNPKKSAMGIYRQYHHMYSIKKNKFKTIPSNWLKNYEDRGIDYRDIKKENFYYWDYEVINILNKYGLDFFSKIDIWNVDWNNLSKKYNKNLTLNYVDPRSKTEKLLFWWLKKTQYYSNSIFIKIIDLFFKLIFKL